MSTGSAGNGHLQAASPEYRQTLMHVAQRWSWVWGNDTHENKDLKRVARRFRCPQNFLLPMTLK
ncbi:hypothetical protein EJ076_28810 [Mesorhizobium sp. M7D.F.Ca.US.005.01.1.1]|nr:hypothetical protein EJ076_28810 [Mesorhizobium sp. M7D.F.Ca.US.005.01.1.1]